MTQNRQTLGENRWFFIGPALLIYLTFAIWPMLDVLVVSFQDWDDLSEGRGFGGLDNYVYVLRDDPVFWMAFENTVIWALLSRVVPPAIGLMLAMGLNQAVLWRAPLRAIYYLPIIFAPIAVATMWRWMYDPFFGLFARVMSDAGWAKYVPDFLGEPDIALYSVFVAYIWQQVGFSMVLFLAGLQNVNRPLIKAAELDGATRWNVFKHVTLPVLGPTVTIVLVLSVIHSLRAFDTIYGMTGGGAISVMLLLITLAIVLPYMQWSQKRELDQ